MAAANQNTFGMAHRGATRTRRNNVDKSKPCWLSRENMGITLMSEVAGMDSRKSKALSSRNVSKNEGHPPFTTTNDKAAETWVKGGDFGSYGSTILAAVVMHAPGLYVKIQFEDSFSFSCSLISAAIEGLFLLLLMLWICKACFILYVDSKYYFGSHVVSCVSLAVGAAAGCSIAVFVISAISSDAAFRLTSGNMDPTTGQVAAGYEDAKGYLLSQMAIDPFGTFCSLAFGVFSFVGGLYIYLKHRWVKSSDGRYQPMWRRQYRLYMMLLFWAVTIFSMEDFYSPVAVAFFSIFLRQNFGVDIPVRSHKTISHGPHYPKAKGGPNVIFIQHESFASSAFNTEKGRSAMPYFSSLVKDDPNMFLFENSRSVSGNTIDAMPALIKGCLPFTDEAIEYVHSRGLSIAHDFLANGYHTASFSSRAIDQSIITGQWHMLYDVFVGGMDFIVDPISQGLPRDNNNGCDDNLMLPKFKEWISFLNNATASGPSLVPFYAQFYSFNTHWPYWKSKTYNEPDRYFSSFRTVDEFLKGIFDILINSGQLNNTIIVGSGDHGEDGSGKNYARIGGLTNKVLQVPTYIYYPLQLMRDNTVEKRLRRNTKKMTSILDLYPTIRSILYHGNPRYESTNGTESLHKACLTGLDLTSVDIQDDRVTAAYNLVSRFNLNHRYWALLKKDRALYHRQSKDPFPALRQGKNNSYIMSFEGCGSSCLVDLNETGKREFQLVVETFMNDTNIGDEVKESEFVDFFQRLVNS